jgi:hypothetical protein
MIKPLSKPASAKPQAHSEALNAQCMGGLLAVVRGAAESDGGDLEDIERSG